MFSVRPLCSTQQQRAHTKNRQQKKKKNPISHQKQHKNMSIKCCYELLWELCSTWINKILENSFIFVFSFHSSSVYCARFAIFFRLLLILINLCCVHKRTVCGHRNVMGEKKIFSNEFKIKNHDFSLFWCG